MADRIELSISQSRDIIHVGTHFLYYIKVRNSLDKAIFLKNLTYDVPKGFFLVKKCRCGDETGQPDAGNAGPEKGGTVKPAGCFTSCITWFCLMFERFREYFNPPNWEETSLEKPREHNLNGVKILPNEAHIIILPFQVGAHFPRMAISADTYHLDFEVRYTIDKPDTGNPDDIHFQQIPADIIIYSHMGWLFLGAMAGGIVGAFLKIQSQSQPMSFFQMISDLFIGILLGLVLAVVFKRKSNVQSFISIEDAWGGFLIGIIGGYGGINLLGTYLNIPVTTSASNVSQVLANVTQIPVT